MTINIGLLTSDAIVFGCDSVASATGYYLDPTSIRWETDPATGETLQDANGKYTLKFDFNNFERIVTNAWGGVTKMFPVHPDPCPMVAVTAGLAKLNDRPIDSLAADFSSRWDYGAGAAPLQSSDEVCEAFRVFFREQYEQHYKDSPLPENLRDGPEFLVGGFSRGENFPCIYRIKIKENNLEKTYFNGQTGIAWNGQSDAVERFIRGYDSSLRADIRRTVRTTLGEYSTAVSDYVAALVNDVLEKTGQKMPEGVEIHLPEAPEVEINWGQYRTRLDYANLPRQEAINFVSFLVKLQAGKSRFAWGVPTVGGRTHIGLVTKDKGLELLNEPKLTHRDVGFGDDV